MHPRTALTVCSREMIEPAWTASASFVLAYESPPAKTVYLVVAGGGAIAGQRDGAGRPIATTISGPAGSLELVLAGGRTSRRS